MNELKANVFDTELGQMMSLSDDNFLYLLEFLERKKLQRELNKFDFESGKTRISRQIEEEMMAYFAGRLQDFKTPIFLPGTEFQQSVWRAVAKVPFGQTRTYKEIAQKIGQPRASLAVGAANAANQFVILVPCHRLIRSDGGLAGYAAGLWRKKWLLEHEKEMLGNE